MPREFFQRKQKIKKYTFAEEDEEEEEYAYIYQQQEQQSAGWWRKRGIAGGCARARASGHGGF